MTNRVQTSRYYTSRQRPPTSEKPGELYVNYPDIQIGVLDPSRDPVDFVAVRFFSASALYYAGDTVVYLGIVYKALTTIAAGAFNSAQWIAYANLNDVAAQILTEATARELQDSVLATKIDDEITTREAEDSILQTQINALTGGITFVFPPGISLDYYSPSPPSGWLLEDGSIYNISTYPALGALLGGRFGGDGTTTFAVPNSAGLFGVAVGTGFAFGTTGGNDGLTILFNGTGAAVPKTVVPGYIVRSRIIKT